MLSRKLIAVQRQYVRTSVSFNGTNERMSYAQGAGNRRTFTLSCWLKTNSGNMGIQGWASSNDGIIISSGDLLFAPGSGLEFETVNDPSDSVYRHLVFRCDTTQASAANRIRVYESGSLLTPLSESPGSQNWLTDYNNSDTFYLGWCNSVYYGGIMAEVIYCDGQSYAPTEFGKTVNGTWVPKAPNVTFGTNGFYLRFQNPNSLGLDSSGNGNNLTLSNMDSSNWSNSDFPP